jgi:hypothetical protein
MDGDILEIPSSLSLLHFVLKNFFCVDHSTKEFKCVHIWKEPNEKANIFDPTPPQQPTHKVSKGCLVDPSTDLPCSESVDISSRHSVSEVEPLPPFTLLWTHQHKKRTRTGAGYEGSQYSYGFESCEFSEVHFESILLLISFSAQHQQSIRCRKQRKFSVGELSSVRDIKLDHLFFKTHIPSTVHRRRSLHLHH